MNLVDCYRRKDANVVISDEIRLTACTLPQGNFEGFDVPPNAGEFVVVKDIFSFWKFRCFPQTIGWYACLLPSAKAKKGTRASRAVRDTQEASTQLELYLCGHQDLRDRQSETVVTQVRHQPAAVFLPFTTPRAWTAGKYDLVVAAGSGNASHLFLGANRAWDLQEAVDLCKGEGFELGAGYKPRVLDVPGEVCVRYVEKLSYEDWQNTYNESGGFQLDEEAWKKYILGDAQHLPAEDGTLDFIFSSHLFEHLPNPLGHFAIWKRKLRPGGKIVCVVPNIEACFDYRAVPVELSEYAALYRTNDFSISDIHRERWAEYHGLSLEHVKKRMTEGFSIHTNYFNREGISRLLDFAVRELGFSGYYLRFEEMFFQFYFCLYN